MLFSIAAERSAGMQFEDVLPGVLVEAVDTVLSATLSVVFIEDAV
jgi:hypothetical protein